MTKKASIKKPWLAALLNIVPGLGYLYLDRKRAFGWLLLTAIVIATSAMLISEDSAISSSLKAGDIVALIGSLLMWIAFMFDAYKLASNQSRKADYVTNTELVKLRTPSQHRAGMIIAGLTLLAGVGFVIICWAHYYYALGTFLMLPVSVASMLLYRKRAGAMPYGGQAWQLLAVLFLTFILMPLVAVIPDVIRWYAESATSGGLHNTLADAINYYVSIVTYVPTWAAYEWELLQAGIIFALISLPLVFNARKIKTTHVLADWKA